MEDDIIGVKFIDQDFYQFNRENLWIQTPFG